MKRPTLKELGVEIDGAHRFGDSRIAGTGVPTSAIANLFKAGDSIEAIRADYEITREQAEAAIRFEFFRHRFKREFKAAEKECREIWRNWKAKKDKEVDDAG